MLWKGGNLLVVFLSGFSWPKSCLILNNKTWVKVLLDLIVLSLTVLSTWLVQHWHLPMETAAFAPSPMNTFLFLVDPCCTEGENNAGNTEAENNCC